MEKWDTPASMEKVEKAISALKANGINACFVANGAEAKRKALEIIPQGAKAMNMSSVTLDTIGISKEIMESGRCEPVRKMLMSMDRKTHGQEMQMLGAAPEWAIGSVHAVTESGEVLIASQSGSQLPAYSYGASRVLWVVGTQKIVKDRDEAIRRIYEYVLPLESERAKKAYGVPGSAVNKLLVINKEVKTGRIDLIFVGEKLGF
jgi:hypothetical protein